MPRFLVRRLVQSLVLLVLMSATVFVGLYQIGNPIDLMIDRNTASDADIERVKSDFGLDRPIWEQYAGFVRRAVTGDLGTSFQFFQPATTLILDRLPATLELALVAQLLAIGIGLPLGLYAGIAEGSAGSRAVMAGSILGFSLPSFWVGLMLIMIFAVELGWLPSTGRGATATVLGIETSLLTADGWRHILLPAFNLSLTLIAVMIRLTRAGVREVLSQDFVKFARAKGLPERDVMIGHVLRNILVPIVTVIGLQFGSLIAFGVVTETIFAWPGMGKLLIDSIMMVDRPVVVAWLMITVTLFVLVNLLVDICYSIIDPRVRLQDLGS